MQGQQGELPGADAFDDPGGGRRLNLGVADMAPPNQDVHGIQVLEALLGVIDANRLNGEARNGPQVVRDLIAQPIRISFFLSGLALVPDADSNPGGLRSFAARGRQNGSSAHQPVATGDHVQQGPLKHSRRQYPQKTP